MSVLWTAQIKLDKALKDMKHAVPSLFGYLETSVKHSAHAKIM